MTAFVTAMTTPDKIVDWVARARKGQWFTYHVGFLMVDRHRNKIGDAVRQIADAAWRAYERGDVVLVQRKLGERLYEYRMRRR